MTDENKAKGRSSQSGQQPPAESKPRETASPKPKGDYDRFVLGKVFSDPRTVFSVSTPRVKDLQKDALFVLDANALLAPFKMGEGQAADIAKVYRKFAQDDRIFVPKRAVQEFARNRPTMLRNIFDDLYNRKSNLGRVDATECPILEGRDVHKRLTAAAKAFQVAREAYSDALQDVMNEIRDWSWDDLVSKLYDEIFTSDRIIDFGREPDAALADLDHRTLHNIPPGYKDKSKDDGGIGDVLIWHSILRAGKERKRNILFVSNDEKADWVVQTRDKTIAVRPELPYEFHAETGCHFGLVNYSDFLRYGKAAPKTVERAKEVEKQMEAMELELGYDATKRDAWIKGSRIKEICDAVAALGKALTQHDVPAATLRSMLSKFVKAMGEVAQVQTSAEEALLVDRLRIASADLYNSLSPYADGANAGLVTHEQQHRLSVSVRAFSNEFSRWTNAAF